MDYFVDRESDWEAVGLVHEGRLVAAFPCSSGVNGLLVALEALEVPAKRLDSGPILAGGGIYLESLADLYKVTPKKVPDSPIIIPDPEYDYDEYAGLAFQPLGKKSLYLLDPELYGSIESTLRCEDDYEDFLGAIVYAHPEDVYGYYIHAEIESLAEEIKAGERDILRVSMLGSGLNGAGLYSAYVLFGRRIGDA